MATVKNYRFPAGKRDDRTISETIFEFDETDDVWNSSDQVVASPEFNELMIKPVRMIEKGNKKFGVTPASLPMNIPDLSKIVGKNYSDEEKDDDDGEDITTVPPHVFLARQFARTEIASFSMREGVGRTLKGRDLSKVRNAIWEKLGFEA